MTFVKHNPNSFNHFVNELLNQVPPAYNEISGFGIQPPTNIHETNEGYHIEIVAPGKNKEDFKINVNNGLLTVGYQKKEEEKSETYKTLRREFKNKNFTRSFSLENKVNADGIIAKYENGILNVFLPKKEEIKAQPKEISVL